MYCAECKENGKTEWLLQFAPLTVKLDVFNSQNQTQYVKVRVHVSVSSRLRGLSALAK